MNNQITNNEDEIDLIELFRIVKEGRKTVFKYLIVFGIIGLFVAIFSETEYTASTTGVLQSSEGNKLGNLGGLAAMAGINIGAVGSSSEVSPKLYPKIIESLPFKRAMLKAPVNIDGKTITFKDYYTSYYHPGVLFYVKKYTIGLPSVIISIFKGKQDNTLTQTIENDSIYRISKEEIDLFNRIKNQLSVNVNDKEGTLKISFSMPEALASAQMTKFAQQQLEKFVIDFKVEKLKSDYKFIEKGYHKAKRTFLQKQQRLYSFKDRNQGLVLSKSLSRVESLQAEYNLAYNIYSEFAKQLESQKIKLEEKTPVFTVLDPVSVPTEKSKPKRLLILVIWLFLGTVLGVGIVFGKNFLNNIKE